MHKTEDLEGDTESEQWMKLGKNYLAENRYGEIETFLDYWVV